MSSPWARTFRLGRSLEGARFAKVLHIAGGEVVVRVFWQPPRIGWSKNGDFPTLVIEEDGEVPPDDLRVLSLNEWEALEPSLVEISASLLHAEAIAVGRAVLSNEGKLHPVVLAELVTIEPSRHPGFAIRACAATLDDGTRHPHVAFVGDLDTVPFMTWFAKNRLSAGDVAHVEASPERLPPAIATQVYGRQPTADETYVFVVETARGLKIRFETGLFPDFPGIPAGMNTEELLSLLPEGAPSDTIGATPPDFKWCLYEAEKSEPLVEG
jgi:hypothetical protein